MPYLSLFVDDVTINVRRRDRVSDKPVRCCLVLYEINVLPVLVANTQDSSSMVNLKNVRDYLCGKQRPLRNCASNFVSKFA